MSIDLQLKRFDINSIQDDSIVFIIGKRGTGKSTICKNILCSPSKCDIPAKMIIAPYESSNHFYGDFVSQSSHIHDKYDPIIMENFISNQKEMKRSGENIDTRSLIVFDQGIYDDNVWKKDNNIGEIFFNGRNLNISGIFLQQGSFDIPPKLRHNVDYVFILCENIVANRKRLYDQFAGMFKTFELFCTAMDQCTFAGHECLVINNCTQSNKIEDQVFLYKAEL